MMKKVEGFAIVNTSTLFISSVLSSIHIPISAFLTLSTLMVIDVVVGLGRSYRLQIPITSYRIKLGVISKLGVLLIVLSFGLAFTHSGLVIDDLKEYIQLILWLFILSELYSIVSNVYAIKTGDNLPEVEVLSLIGTKLKSLIETVLPNHKDRE